MKKNKSSLIKAAKPLGLDKKLLICKDDSLILHYSHDRKILERIKFDDADKCYHAFQDICFQYELLSHNSPYKVDFPHETPDADYGTMLIVSEGNQIKEVFELVNPEYYG
jgi:hypothetical protein